ncbi:MAG: isochorismatase family protein [Microthrixaceae bacterium]
MNEGSQRYDRRTALVVVDLQNDFADPGGSLHVAGGDDIVDGVNEEIRRARANDSTVVLTQDWHLPVARTSSPVAGRGPSTACGPGGRAPPRPEPRGRPGPAKGNRRRGRLLGVHLVDPSRVARNAPGSPATSSSAG